jgi:hypothetical protein
MRVLIHLLLILPVLWVLAGIAQQGLDFDRPLRSLRATFGNEVGAISNFIPTIWSARGLRVLQKAYVYGSERVVNRNWEGDIQNAGDTVKITSLGDVTVSNYTRNADIPAPEVLSDDATTLVIDQAKVFNFAVDDVDAAQANTTLVDKAMAKAANKLRDIADQFIASHYVDASVTIGTDIAPVTPDSDTAYSYLVDLGVALDEGDVPSEGRWTVVPPWYVGLLSLNDLFIAATGDDILRNGFAGRAAGFEVMVSNNVPNVGGVDQIMAGTTDAITFADQLAKVEAYRPERRFSDAVKGLHVYGAKTVQPELLAVLKAERPAA